MVLTIIIYIVIDLILIDDEYLNAFKKASKICIPESFKASFKAGRILRKGMSVYVEDEPKIPNPEEIAKRYKSSLKVELDRINKKIREGWKKNSFVKAT